MIIRYLKPNSFLSIEINPIRILKPTTHILPKKNLTLSEIGDAAMIKLVKQNLIILEHLSFDLMT